jgi:L-alanine-DL-glutamate epimerase-like enolase superfamily enzyme
MKIVDLSVLMHERRWDQPFVGPKGVVPLGVLTIETDEGIAGRAFVSGPGGDAASQLVQLVKPQLLNRDPLDIGAIWLQLWRANRVLLPMTMGAVDIALWDIAGKAAGLPIHRLLGSYKQKVPAYLSSYMHAEPEEYAAEAAHWKKQGWTGYKLHPPTQRRRFGEAVATPADAAACRAVRDEVGADLTLMLDSAWEYSYAEALRIGRAIEDLDYSWYEDPLAADDLYGYTRLNAKLDIPIISTDATAGGEIALPYFCLL